MEGREWKEENGENDRERMKGREWKEGKAKGKCKGKKRYLLSNLERKLDFVEVDGKPLDIRLHKRYTY
jgi:hypothetical protein